MPVFKYKTFEEAEKALWNTNPDEEYFKQVADLWDFAEMLSPYPIEPGVYKFKTMEEANEHRRELESKMPKNNLQK